MDVDKIYEETRSEIENLKTEQAVRLEKIKTLAGELDMAVDANLTKNVADMKANIATEKAELVAKLEEKLKELEDEGKS